MKIYVIRHGETALNAAHVKQGWVDEPLNEAGRELARLTGRALSGVRFDACVSSPLVRAKETVELVLRESGNGAVPVQIDERIKEFNFGEEENKPVPKELPATGIARLYYLDALNFPGYPGGESIRHLCQRTGAFLKELVARDDGKTWLIGIHGCALRAMLNPLYEHPEHFWQGCVPPNCAVTILEVRDGKPVIVEKDRVYYDHALLKDHHGGIRRI